MGYKYSKTYVNEEEQYKMRLYDRNIKSLYVNEAN